MVPIPQQYVPCTADTTSNSWIITIDLSDDGAWNFNEIKSKLMEFCNRHKNSSAWCSVVEELTGSPSCRIAVFLKGPMRAGVLAGWFHHSYIKPVKKNDLIEYTSINNTESCKDGPYQYGNWSDNFNSTKTDNAVDNKQWITVTSKAQYVSCNPNDKSHSWIITLTVLEDNSMTTFSEITSQLDKFCAHYKGSSAWCVEEKSNDLDAHLYQIAVNLAGTIRAERMVSWFPYAKIKQSTKKELIRFTSMDARHYVNGPYKAGLWNTEFASTVKNTKPLIIKQDETATNISTRYDLEHGNSPEPYKSEELINMVIQIKELEQKALKDDRDAANNRNKIYEMIHSGASSDEVLAKTLEFLGINPSIRTFLKK